ncbi:hypothetical protein vseg_016599 [Gypsophila vaccaria]
MERTHHYYTYTLIFSLVFAISIPSFVFCILAEFKKSKVEDVKLYGKWCELPRSEAFGFGMAALICSSIAQIVGNLIILVGFCLNMRESKSFCWTKRVIIACVFTAVSWISFAISVTLLITASSMNKEQPYGKGWLNGECYIVKDGVFIGAAILVLVSLGCTLVSCVIILSNKFHVSTNNNSLNNGVILNRIK